MSEQRLTLTVEETARILGLSRGACYSAVAANEIPSVKCGRRILVPRARLLALLGEPPSTNGNGGGEPIEEASGPGPSPSASDRGDRRTALES